MAHVLRHHSTQVATDSLLQLISGHMPEGTDFPMSKYLFNKHFLGSERQLTAHLYCKNCLEYLCIYDSNCKFVLCQCCQTNNELDALMKNGSYFIFFDINSQLISILQKGLCDLSKPERRLDMRDISDSSGYHNLPLGKDDITLTWNTDGASAFESSGSAVWPLQLMINELPFHLRCNNIVMAGLWFGEKKPEMNTFLKPFVNIMLSLSSEGLVWKRKNETVHSNVFLGASVFDSPARCMVHCMKQFNGEYSCPWCTHPGNVVPKGRGHVRVFDSEIQYPARSHGGYARQANIAVSTGVPCYGVKGPSILLLLSYFNIINSFVVDYMHAICLGVVRSTTSIWLDTANHARPCYLGRKIGELNKKLLNIKPPSENTRTPRSLDTRKFWKASEWRSWLLYYSPAVLVGTLPTAYLNNWLLLINIMYTLLSDKIPLDMLDSINAMCVYFVKDYEKLYGKECMTFNMHQILHLVDSVRNWGPLWCYSAFPFENMNGKLLRLFHGTQNIQWQIAHRFVLIMSLPNLGANAFSNNLYFENFFKMLCRNYNRLKCATLCHGILCVGNNSYVLMNYVDKVAFQRIDVNVKGLFKYRKIVINGLIYKPVNNLSTRARITRRNDSVVLMKNGNFYEIHGCYGVCKECNCFCLCEKQPYLLLKKITVTNANYSLKTLQFHAHLHFYKKIVRSEIAPVLEVFHCNDIEQKCVLVSCDEQFLVLLTKSDCS